MPAKLLRFSLSRNLPQLTEMRACDTTLQVFGFKPFKLIAVEVQSASRNFSFQTCPFPCICRVYCVKCRGFWLGA